MEVVRPLLLNKLLLLRNDIEHEDAEPPRYCQCKEYLDVVWYFLKTTHCIASHKVDDIMFTNPNSQFWVQIDITDLSLTKLPARGWLSNNHFTYSQKNDLIRLDVDNIKRASAFDRHHSDRPVTDFFFSGYLNLTPCQTLNLIKPIILSYYIY